MKYAYAVARVRYRELSLLSAQNIEQLLGCETSRQCFAFLAEKGWTVPEETCGAEELLFAEREKLWALMDDLLGEDLNKLDVFLYQNDFHNLKTAVKRVLTDGNDEGIVLARGTVPYDELLQAVKDKSFDQLPAQMRDAAAKAYSTMAETSDGQLCDMILDRAALAAIYEAGCKSDDEVLSFYARITVDFANLKIALRSLRTGKSFEFIRDALAPCGAFDPETLAHAAMSGREAVLDLAAASGYGDAAEVLRQSPDSRVELLADNLVMEAIRPQKYVPYTFGPIAAFFLAKENEIKAVRLILSGKLNGLQDAVIRERLRQMYV